MLLALVSSGLFVGMGLTLLDILPLPQAMAYAAYAAYAALPLVSLTLLDILPLPQARAYAAYAALPLVSLTLLDIRRCRRQGRMRRMLRCR